MLTLLIRACLLVLVAALSVSVGGSQPPDTKKVEPKIPGLRPYYTAFPDIKAPTYEKKVVKKPDGTTGIVTEEKGVVPLPPFPTVAADAPPLRKVQFEQLQEGLAYLAHMEGLIRHGNWSQKTFCDVNKMAVDVYDVAAELEEKPAKRVPWYEARVRKLKESEQFIQIRVEIGAASPQDLYATRFARLQAEADLLKLKAEVEKMKDK